MVYTVSAGSFSACLFEWTMRVTFYWYYCLITYELHLCYGECAHRTGHDGRSSSSAYTLDASYNLDCFLWFALLCLPNATFNNTIYHS